MNSSNKTPGEILRAARELRGYQSSEVAERLRLSLQTILDIEKDEYSRFTAEIYLLGHMRSYARLVNADAAELTKAYERMGVQIESDPQIPVLMASDVPISKRSLRTKRKVILWAGLGAIMVLILMIMLWWQQQRHHSEVMVTVTKPVVVMPPSSAIETAEKTTDKDLQASKPKKPPHTASAHRSKRFVPDYAIQPVKS